MDYLRQNLSKKDQNLFSNVFGGKKGRKWEWHAARTLADGLLIPSAVNNPTRPFGLETGVLSNLDVRNDTLLDASSLHFEINFSDLSSMLREHI